MTKRCCDDNCPRVGEDLPKSDFSRNNAMRDRLDPYCRECRSRRNRESREYRKLHPARKVKRQPVVIAMSAKDPLAEVYEAIAKGRRTRERIQRSTHLTYDDIGDVLVDLIFNYRAVQIRNREFILVNSERVAA